MADRSTLIVAAYITHSPHSANNTHTRTLSVQPDPGTAQMCIRHGCSVRRVRWWFVLKMQLLYPPLYSARCILLNISNELNMFILYEFCYSPASTRDTHTHTHVIHATAADNAQSIRLNNFRRVCFVGLCCRFHTLILLTLFVSIVSGISIFFGLLFYGCRCCGRMHAVGFQWDIFKLM